jgi:two-component system, chemotaxis family, protein-glutamate methylesterase/glutaminase
LTVKLIKSGQFYMSSSDDVFKVRLGAGFYICGFDRAQRIAFCYWSAQKVSIASFANLLLEQFPAIKFEHSQFAIKIVADQSDGYELERTFQNLNVKNIKLINRQNVGSEIYFYAKDGRLRAERVLVKTVVPSEPVTLKTKIRVLCIDDSPTIHRLLGHIFDSAQDIEVVGTVLDPLLTEEAIIKHKPDILTVDIHMEGLNGVELLKKILPKYPIPSLLVTSLSINDGPLVIDGLQSGAVDHIQKPTVENIDQFAEEIIEKVRAAASSRVRIPSKGNKTRRFEGARLDSRGLIAIGASTGGTEALASLLVELPSQIPPIFVVQHIPEQFSKAFASRLNDMCAFDVMEARDGLRVQTGCVYIAPGGKHMKIRKNHLGQLSIEVSDGDPVNRHKPSVDVLFRSLVGIAPEGKAMALLLTGMGSDGAQGLLDLKQSGVLTIAQDAESCVVYGMPKVAKELDAATEILPLGEMARAIVSYLKISAAA